MRKCNSNGCDRKKPKTRIVYRKNKHPKYYCAHCGRKL